MPFSFSIDSDGNYGYIKAGADTVTPFKSILEIKASGTFSGSSPKNIAVKKGSIICLACAYASDNYNWVYSDNVSYDDLYTSGVVNNRSMLRIFRYTSDGTATIGCSGGYKTVTFAYFE